MTGKHYEARQCAATYSHDPHNYLLRLKPTDLGQAFTCPGVHPVDEQLPGLERSVRIVQGLMDQVGAKMPQSEILILEWVRDLIQAEIEYIEGEES